MSGRVGQWGALHRIEGRGRIHFRELYMGNEERAANWDRVLVDVCTQRDFLDPGAILQVANRDALVPRLEHVFGWARRNRIAIVSSVESHRPSEPLAGFPLHCIDGTHGQMKPAFTYVHPHILVEVDNSLALPPDLLDKYHQLIFRKRARDVMSNPKADRFLTSLHAKEFIVFGVGLEQAIRSLALGLLARHKRVTVVSDACGYWAAGDADLSLRQLAAKHIRIVTVDELTAVPEPAPTRRAGRRTLLSRLRPDRARPQRHSRSRAS
jgi:nicotinamidase-related amidase